MVWKLPPGTRPRPSRPRRRLAPSRRPVLDCLEGRDVPAAPAGTEFLVHSSTDFVQTQPAVASDADGDYVVVWVNKEHPGPYPAEDICARLFDAAGNPRGPEFIVNTYTDYEQLNPSVAMDAVGNFVVTWQSNYPEANGFEIQARRFDSAGNPLGDEFRVNDTELHDQVLPDVSMNAEGKFVVVWETAVDQVREGQPGIADQIYAKRYDTNGAPRGGEFRIDEDGYAGQYNIFQYKPAVSIDTSGNFAASWTSVWGKINTFGGIIPDPHTTRIFTRTFDDLGVPTAPQLMVANILTYNPETEEWVTDYSYIQENSDVAVRRNGIDLGFVVVYDQQRLYGLPQWKDPDPFKANVYARMFNWAFAPADPFRVNTYTNGTQANPSVAVDASGNFVVTWESSFAGAGVNPPQSDPGVGIYARSFNYLGQGGPEFHVNTTQDYDQTMPAIAMDDEGHFVIVWQSVDVTGNNDVFGQRYDP